MGAIRRICAVLLAVAAASVGVAAAAIQHTVQAAIRGTVHVVPRTGFLLSYACPRPAHASRSGELAARWMRRRSPKAPPAAAWWCP